MEADDGAGRSESTAGMGDGAVQGAVVLRDMCMNTCISMCS